MARSDGLNFSQAVSLIERVCDSAGSRNIVSEARRDLKRAGVIKAVRDRNDSPIFDWLIRQVSYQGISDAAADTYMALHGAASSEGIERSLDRPRPECDLLQSSFWDFTGCNYKKSASACSRPRHLRNCPVPKLDLRRGDLSQAAFSLHLFMRDIAGGDFVRWVDERLDRTSAAGLDGARALIEPMSQVHGLSSKVLSMTLATFLMGADIRRPLWVAVGGDMIAIDSLVHNFLARTGIARGLMGEEHQYGPACYNSYRCAAVLRHIACDIDGRAFNIDYPKIFPRFVQQAIWRYCAQQYLDVCNGNRIDDSSRCCLESCILFDDCARLPLGRQRLIAIK